MSEGNYSSAILLKLIKSSCNCVVLSSPTCYTFTNSLNVLTMTATLVHFMHHLNIVESYFTSQRVT
mgnify:CR=1 FL=1